MSEAVDSTRLKLPLNELRLPTLKHISGLHRRLQPTILRSRVPAALEHHHAQTYPTGKGWIVRPPTA